MTETAVTRLEHDHGPPLAFNELSLDRWQIRFLQAYAETGGIRAAVRKAKISHVYHYRWMKECADYSLAYNIAREQYGDLAEGAIRERGIHGFLKPLSYKGKLTGDKVREYSDQLALAVIKALKPEYRDGTQIAIGPAKIEIEIIQAQPSGSESIAIDVSADKIGK